MADTLTASAPARAQRRRSLAARLMREPLMHFLLLGALVFAINFAIEHQRARARMIVVTPAIRQLLVAQYTEANAAPPDAEQTEALVRAWIIQETLVREALALGLDRGDDMIRERVGHKMQLLVFSDVVVPPMTDAVLQSYFQAHRDKYDVPDKATFLAVVIDGPDARKRADALLEQMRAGTEPESLRRQARVYADRPRPSLEAVFGSKFVAALWAQTPGEWRVLDADQGAVIARLETLRPGRQVSLDDVHDAVVDDWTGDERRAQANARLTRIQDSYGVRREDRP